MSTKRIKTNKLNNTKRKKTIKPAAGAGSGPAILLEEDLGILHTHTHTYSSPLIGRQKKWKEKDPNGVDLPNGI